LCAIPRTLSIREEVSPSDSKQCVNEPIVML
jgi:hypothetical protein